MHAIHIPPQLSLSLPLPRSLPSYHFHSSFPQIPPQLSLSLPLPKSLPRCHYHFSLARSLLMNLSLRLFSQSGAKSFIRFLCVSLWRHCQLHMSVPDFLLTYCFLERISYISTIDMESLVFMPHTLHFWWSMADSIQLEYFSPPA